MEKERMFKDGDVVVFKDRETNNAHQAIYVISRMVKMKRPDNGEWVDAYGYYKNDRSCEFIPDEMFIREASDMEEKFERKWRPKFGDAYYVVDYDTIGGMFHVTKNQNMEGMSDKKILDHDLGFETYMEAETYRDKLNEAIKNVK